MLNVVESESKVEGFGRYRVVECRMGIELLVGLNGGVLGP